jgi:hypothetical protein
MIYIHDSVSASNNVATARAITVGQFNPTLTESLNASLHATSDIGVISPTYVFATPVLGGQAAVSLAAIYGNSSADINGTLSGTLGPVAFSRAFDVSDSRDAFGDLFPQFALRWNAGVNNWMTYLTGDIPVGAYDSARLANLGLGHGAIDAGGGYTYFDQKTGYEFSTVAGFTYNLINPSTDYQNGVDFHLDWAASKFLTKQWQIGVAGYFFNQISCDSGIGDKVGCFETRVAGIGPRSATSFRSTSTIRVTSTSRGSGNLRRNTGRTVGIHGSRSQSHRLPRARRLQPHRWFTSKSPSRVPIPQGPEWVRFRLPAVD